MDISLAGYKYIYIKIRHAEITCYPFTNGILKLFVKQRTTYPQEGGVSKGIFVPMTQFLF